MCLPRTKKKKKTKKKKTFFILLFLVSFSFPHIFFELCLLSENPKNDSLRTFFSDRNFSQKFTRVTKMVQLEIPLSFPRGPVRVLPSSFSSLQ